MQGHGGTAVDGAVDYAGYGGGYDHSGAEPSGYHGCLLATTDGAGNHAVPAGMPSGSPSGGGWSFDNGVRLPGVVCWDDANSIQILVCPHGLVDVPGLLRKLAARHGLLSLSRNCAELVATSKIHNKLLDTDFFDGQEGCKRPSGIFPGATGKTTVWREFFQQPSKKHWWDLWPGIQVGPPLPSHMLIIGYTWFYEQTADYESRVAIMVTDPKTCRAGQWESINAAAVQNQMKVAKQLALELFAELEKIGPSDLSVRLRQQMGANPQTALYKTTSRAISRVGSSPMRLHKPGPDPIGFDYNGK